MYCEEVNLEQHIFSDRRLQCNGALIEALKEIDVFL